MEGGIPLAATKGIDVVFIDISISVNDQFIEADHFVGDAAFFKSPVSFLLRAARDFGIEDLSHSLNEVCTNR